jgi:hypothetical protein
VSIEEQFIFPSVMSFGFREEVVYGQSIKIILNQRHLKYFNIKPTFSA